MIGILRGLVAEKTLPHVVLEVAGVGYELETSMATYVRLPQPGQETQLYTHCLVRDDALLLYGFADPQERRLFRELIAVSGLSPPLALTVLSGTGIAALARAVQQQDTALLVRLPGMERSTAERLVVEMKECVAALNVAPEEEEASNKVPALPPGDAAEDAVSALVALGYKLRFARQAVAGVQKEGMETRMLIRRALKTMSASQALGRETVPEP